MDYKLLFLALSGLLVLAYTVSAELAEEDYRLLNENDLNLQQMILKGHKHKGKTEAATRRPIPTLGPNPRPKPSPEFTLKSKKVITIEDWETVDKEPKKKPINDDELMGPIV